MNKVNPLVYRCWLDRDRLLMIIKEAYSEYKSGKIDKSKSGAEHMADSIINEQSSLIKFQCWPCNEG